MKPELSKREIILIVIAGILLLGFLLFRFAAGPIYAHYQEKLSQYDNLIFEKEMLDLKFENEAITRENYESAEKTFLDIEKDYLPIMPNEEIDKILTGICLQNGLQPVTLAIYDAVEVDYTQKSDEEGAEDEGSRTAGRPAAFVLVAANMDLNGGYDSLKKLIDAVDKIEYIRISRVAFSKEQIVRTGSANVSVFFEVTMLKQRI